MNALQVAQYLSEAKNLHYRKFRPDRIILTADTTVIYNNTVLNKPKDENEATDMLSSLSGKIHQVVTGVCISSPEKSISFSDVTEVQFYEISEEEIQHYITNYQPLDKAGAYGIQEWIGMTQVVHINGSFYNVMGLPTHRVYQTLKTQFSQS